MATTRKVAQQQQEAEEEIPFDVVEAISPDDVGDLAEVKGDSAIESVKDVTFIVVKASIDTQYETPNDTSSDWAVKRLKLEVKVGPNGTDGEGKYAEKRFFPSLVVAYPMHTVDGRRTPNLEVLERIHQTNADAGKKNDKKTGQPKPFPRDYWLKQAQLDFKEFALATGLAEMKDVGDTGRKVWGMTAKLDDNMLAILASGDVEFVANVQKSYDAFRQEDRNELRRYRAVQAAEAE